MAPRRYARPIRAASCIAATAAPPGPAAPPYRADAGTGMEKSNLPFDINDIWWPDGEPGWGIQFVQNAELAFATMYVYGANGQPTFYVAVLDNMSPGSGVWSGPLSATTGPWFGGPFNPAAVVETEVGVLTFIMSGPGTGSLEYNVGPTIVSKTIHRQPLRLENNSGDYFVVATRTLSGTNCGLLSDYQLPKAPSDLTIQQVAATATVTMAGFAPGVVTTCTADPATYTQFGRLGRYVGMLSCDGGARTATMQLYEIVNGVKSITGRYDVLFDDGCMHRGRFSGLSKTP